MENALINEQVTQWLGQYLSTTSSKVADLMKYETAVVYLIVWPIMEQKLFDGFMQKKKIIKTAEKYSTFYSELDAEDSARIFHQRYQDRKIYKHLVHDDSFVDFEEIIRTPFENLSPLNKTVMMFYVVYRYRNNIFHGNKGIESWSKYRDQITRCIQFMMKICDCHMLHFQAQSELEDN